MESLVFTFIKTKLKKIKSKQNKIQTQKAHLCILMAVYTKETRHFNRNIYIKSAQISQVFNIMTVFRLMLHDIGHGKLF